MTTKQKDSIRRELQISCILEKIHEYRLNWLLHLQRMPQIRIPLKSYHYKPQWRRAIGRPKKRWREQLWLWRRNGSKGPILGVDDNDDYDYDDDIHSVSLYNTCVRNGKGGRKQVAGTTLVSERAFVTF
jgi:hypothetical protein